MVGGARIEIISTQINFVCILERGGATILKKNSNNFCRFFLSVSLGMANKREKSFFPKDEASRVEWRELRNEKKNFLNFHFVAGAGMRGDRKCENALAVCIADA